MNLRLLRSLLAFCFCACMTGGCSGAPPPNIRTAASVEHELDSVVSGCSRTLAVRPDDADIHTRLAQALLARIQLREMNFRDRHRPQPDPYRVILRDIGRPVDSVSGTGVPETLRVAESHIERALGLKPEDPAALRIKGRLLLELSRDMPGDSILEKATALQERSLALDPASPEGYYNLGCCLFRRNRSPEAIAAMNKSLSLDSSNSLTYLTLGEVYMDTGNVAVAFACFENAARLGLNTAGECMRLAELYTDEQAERRLLGRFASLRMEAPGILKPTVRAGLRLLSIYHPGIAMNISSRALEIDSSCADAHLLRSRLILDEGDTASALDEFLEAFAIGTAPYWSYLRFPHEFLDRACQRIPGSDISLSLLAGRSADTTDSARALSEIQAAVQRRPGSALAAFFLGRAYAARRDTAGAVEWFDRVMAMPPVLYPNMYMEIEWIYLMAGQITKAVYVYQKCLLGDYGGWVQELLGKENRRTHFSQERLQTAAAICAVGFECSWMIGRGKAGDWKSESIRLFERAMEIIPGSALPYLCLGSLYIDIGDRASAYRYYRKAASMGSTDAADRLRKMDREK